LKVTSRLATSGSGRSHGWRRHRRYRQYGDRPNLNDQLYQNPLARTVTSLFYLTRATDSLGGGRANPSISGGSVDNQYVAMANITDWHLAGWSVFASTERWVGNTSYIRKSR
jgi:hypothetical protein